MSYYPVNLDIRGRKCVVIGGGTVAERKVDMLLDSQAKVTVVAPALTPKLRELATSGKITHVPEKYTTEALESAFLVIAATDDREINSTASREAQKQGILVNVVDDPELCTFLSPAVVRRGDLQIAVSTSGKSPALARRLREELEERFGPEYEDLVNIIGDFREEIKEKYADMADRNSAYVRILNSNALRLLKAGRRAEAIEKVRKCI